MRTIKTRGHVRGTPGYFPLKDNLTDGSTKWDIYAVGAIVLECDLERDAYFGVQTDKGTRFMVSKYLEIPGVCANIKHIVKRTVMQSDPQDMMGLDEIMQLLGSAKFRKDP